MKGLWALLVVATPALAAPPTAPVVVDDFQSSSAWSAVPASGVTMKLTAEPGPHGNALRVDFDFHGGGGYAVLHRKLDVDLPENYRFEFSLHGETAPQNLELKLIDDSGENVWWCNQVNFEYPREWTLERVRKRQISFAWGPKGGGELHHM
ncbi:MAG TPA: coagulation factor 5/8 type domain-containing protein, partial [Verrucomicrobiae bacterium]|nr:coagulation factor 5/8 type domain-containing protein [Verrucomicrobiae bacterium]